jgi:type IV pilus assembly protein PilP
MNGKTFSVKYALAGTCAVALAFFVSLKFLGHLRAQQGAPPANASTPTTPGTSAAPGNTAPPANAPSAATAAGPNGAQPPPPGAPGKPGTPGNKPAASGAVEFTELEGFLEPFLYDALNRRDPFQPYAEYVPQNPLAQTRPLSPAQKWDLDQLHLVGVMWDVKEPKAMFMSPESEVLVLGRDEGIGNKNGYIAAIREGEVVVIEALRKRGDVIYRTRVLRIER